MSALARLSTALNAKLAAASPRERQQLGIAAIAIAVLIVASLADWSHSERRRLALAVPAATASWTVCAPTWATTPTAESAATDTWTPWAVTAPQDRTKRIGSLCIEVLRWGAGILPRTGSGAASGVVTSLRRLDPLAPRAPPTSRPESPGGTAAGSPAARSRRPPSTRGSARPRRAAGRPRAPGEAW